MCQTLTSVPVGEICQLKINLFIKLLTLIVNFWDDCWDTVKKADFNCVSLELWNRWLQLNGFLSGDTKNYCQLLHNCGLILIIFEGIKDWLKRNQRPGAQNQVEHVYKNKLKKYWTTWFVLASFSSRLNTPNLK